MKNQESSIEKLVLELKNLGHVEMSPQLLNRLQNIPANSKLLNQKVVLNWSLRLACLGAFMLIYSFFISSAIETNEIQQLYSQYFNHLSTLI
jgi:hypothetical protein